MGASVSRRARRVCSSGIVTPIARRIIGRIIKKNANDVLPKYAGEALFKDSPDKEDCPIICFITMPVNLISCTSRPPATISTVPIYDFAAAKCGSGKYEYKTI